MRGKGEGVDTVLSLGGPTYIGQLCMDVCVLNRKGYAQKREESERKARGRPWKREEATEKGNTLLIRVNIAELLPH